MTKVKKTALSLAMAAAMGGMVSSAHAVNLATDGLGDVLLYSYYTARNGWNSLIHITNTSNVATVALKVRFQEAQNTRDVLDFTLVLSPNDVWTGYVTNTDGGPRLKQSSGETSCISPIIPASGFRFSTFGFGGGSDPASVARTEEGHVTVIEMGHALAGTAIDTAAKAKDCAAIDQAFTKAQHQCDQQPVWRADQLAEGPVLAGAGGCGSVHGRFADHLGEFLYAGLGLHE